MKSRIHSFKNLKSSLEQRSLVPSSFFLVFIIQCEMIIQRCASSFVGRNRHWYCFFTLKAPRLSLHVSGLPATFSSDIGSRFRLASFRLETNVCLLFHIVVGLCPSMALRIFSFSLITTIMALVKAVLLSFVHRFSNRCNLYLV